MREFDVSAATCPSANLITTAELAPAETASPWLTSSPSRNSRGAATPVCACARPVTNPATPLLSVDMRLARLPRQCNLRHVLKPSVSGPLKRAGPRRLKRLRRLVPAMSLDADAGHLEPQDVDRVHFAAAAPGERSGLHDQRGVSGGLIPLGGVADVADVEVAGEKEI